MTTPEPTPPLTDDEPTPSLAEYRRQAAENDNTFWYLQSGDHLNLLEEAIERIEAVEALAEQMEHEHGQSWNSISARRIREALADSAEDARRRPESATTPPEGDTDA